MATGTNSIPERLINYRVYNEANALMGMATVDLPELQAMSDTCLLYTSDAADDDGYV